MPVDLTIDIDENTDVRDLVDELTERLPESRIQESLAQEAKRLGLSYGELLVMAVRNLGDHMLTISHLMYIFGLAHEINKFVPNRNTSKTRGDLHIGIDNASITKGRIKRGSKTRHH